MFSSLTQVALDQRSPLWTGWRPATCMPDACFCEAIRDGVLRQPANALSGLAFVVLAFGIILHARRSRRELGAVAALTPMSSRPIYAWIYAGALLVVGLGTVFYHASLTFWGQTADLLGMYLLATFLVLYNAGRLYPITPRRALALYVIGNGVLLSGLVLFPAARRYVFALLVVSAIALEIGARRREKVRLNGRLFMAALAALAFGFSVWVLDITRTLCDPMSWLQGHAVWHIAGAVAAGLVYIYYRDVESAST